MEVILAKSAGFCFGVKRAVDTVYDHIGKKEPIFTFGPIVHNESVVNDLKKKGIKVIESVEELEGEKEGTVIIRAHGVSKRVHEQIKSTGLNVVDATCPFVKRIHKIVEEESANGKQIVVIGDQNHPEVKGIVGWSLAKAIVVDTPEQVDEKCISLEKEIHIVAQTTYNMNKFQELVEIFQKKGMILVLRIQSAMRRLNDRKKRRKSLEKLMS